MLDYTRTIFDKTKKDLDAALTVFRFGTQAIYIAYLIFMLFVPNGIWYIYLPLLIISAAFFTFDIVTATSIRSIKGMKSSLFGSKEKKEKLQRTRRKRSNIRKVKFYVSHSLKLLILSSSLYPIIAFPYSVHPMHVICATVMAFLWILQIVFEVLRFILENRFDLFIEAIHADLEIVTKPVNTVKNTFKRIIGKDVEEPAEPSKERVYLDELVEQRKSERANERSEEKSEKKEKVSEWLEAHIPAFRRKAKNEADSEDTAPVCDNASKESGEI